MKTSKIAIISFALGLTITQIGVATAQVSDLANNPGFARIVREAQLKNPGDTVRGVTLKNGHMIVVRDSDNKVIREVVFKNGRLVNVLRSNQPNVVKVAKVSTPVRTRAKTSENTVATPK